jgi:aminopeptidase N
MSKFLRAASLCCLASALFTPAIAQQTDPAADSALKIYRATVPRINDLVHTKLDVKFDYAKHYMYGKAWITLKPHAYPTDSLRLDAKGMDIAKVSLWSADGHMSPLQYEYKDQLTVNIHLGRTYQPGEAYTVYMEYTAKPDEIKSGGSAAITDTKGLYFINADGKDPNKPIQIWTQGESESSSCWFPTIDHPNQKTTEEIAMTVPAKYVTLSNGRLASQKVNGDGTRTDTWKQELPHAPYLFMMAVGDFKIYKDHWKDKEVSYYLEPKYAPYAKDIFGMTPELIDFYSKTLGVDFPWYKYSQIVVRDYVSGAMENTSATLHGEYVQGTKRELADAYYDAGRSTIAHELFHQWFGDYVTCESWSNLTVNESMADFSEIMWAEHKYGLDEGGRQHLQDMNNYMGDSGNFKKDLVRFHYKSEMDMFDLVTYQKGGCILYMLRNYLGDAVFYKGLHNYLIANALKTGEAQQMRLAMEDASGLDLNWFFNEWYYGAGHPDLDISYNWNPSNNTETVTIAQTQPGKVFQLPMAIDIYAGGNKTRYKVWMKDSTATYSFQVASRPDLVNVDGDKALLTHKTDHKTGAEFTYQYVHAPLFMDRYEAVEYAAHNKKNDTARQILVSALNDPYYWIQLNAIHDLLEDSGAITPAVEAQIAKLASSAPNNLVRASSLDALADLKKPSYLPLFTSAIEDSSYAVEGAGLKGLGKIDSVQALGLAAKMESGASGALTPAIIHVYAYYGDDSKWAYVVNKFQANDIQQQFNMVRELIHFTSRVSSSAHAQEGIKILKDWGIKYKMYGLNHFLLQFMPSLKAKRTALGDTASAAAVDEAVKALSDAGAGPSM